MQPVSRRFISKISRESVIVETARLDGSLRPELRELALSWRWLTRTRNTDQLVTIIIERYDRPTIGGREPQPERSLLTTRRKRKRLLVRYPLSWTEKRWSRM